MNKILDPLNVAATVPKILGGTINNFQKEAWAPTHTKITTDSKSLI